MKILILHLSDIHFEKNSDISNENINAIVNAIKTTSDFASVIIIVSGDIAFSGKVSQYNIAYRFFKSLRDKIRRKFDIGQIEFCIVPGNHDVNHDMNELSRKELENIFNCNKQDEYLDAEKQKMRAFYNHANGLYCFTDRKSLVYTKEIVISGTTICVNLINTGVYSLKIEEDQGFHYLPNYEIDKLCKESKSDYIFTVMHHPHHWYNGLMKKNLENCIYEKSDLIFVGHEHYSSTMEIGYNNSQVKIYSGGELSNKGDWKNSEFYAGILDLQTREYNIYKYKWNDTSKIYVRKSNEKTVLGRNRSNKYNLQPNKEYMDDLLQDKKYMISGKFSDYYVFPRLEEEVVGEKRLGRELTELNEAIEEIRNNKRVIITGRNDSGKTLLLKTLFCSCREEYLTLFVRSYDVHSYENTIRTVFGECYSTEDVSFEKFRQAPLTDKVLILDDADILEEEQLENFLTKAEKEFGIIVYSCNSIVEFDIKERIKKGALEEKYVKYRIQAFYSDKREKLVSNIVNIMVNQDEQTKENIIQLLCEALAKQKNLFRMDPDFIVQFTKYYCNNIGETIKNDGEIFSKVFEANIVSLLKPYAKKMSVDKILIIMDKIAYSMHCNKKYPMDQKEICEIINNYNEDFGSEVDYVDFMDMLTKANILARDNTRYYFVEKNYLAYFVAREMKRKCLEEQDYVEFNKALDYACYGINADILLFVTYITDNLNIIRALMEKAEEYICDWEEFSLSPIKIPYLSDVEQLEVVKATEEDKRKVEEEEIQREKKIEKAKEKETICSSIYSYNEEEELNLIKKMIRALSLLIIISRTLPSFEHMMKKVDKEKCVQLIYTMPLKIFNVWALEVEGVKIELIDEIKSLDDWVYRKEKNKMSDYDALNYLRWESISLLMEIMNSSIGNATKSNTYAFLDSFAYNSNDLYKIEHLMELDKRDNVTEFMREAEEVYLMQKHHLPKIMIQRVAKHFIINSKKIQRSNIQRLNAKLWDGKLNNSALLIGKKRNTNKEQ